MTDIQNKKIKQIQKHNGGGVILSYDFQTLEVKIFSAISCDKNLREVLLSGADLHCNTARNIYPELHGMSDKEIKEHHSGLRSKAKSCLVAGTQVLMSDGKTKSIEYVVPGDTVVSREEFTNKLILSKVVESKETKKTNHLIELEFDNGNILKCTPEHKIRLVSGEYKEAQFLISDEDVDSCNKLISVKRKELKDLVPVYDLEVSNDSNSHNFCANGVFVHNCMFGLLYGKTAFNFSKDWGVSVEEAQKIIDGMMGAYPGIKEYVEHQHQFARENGYVIDVFGCTRPLPDAQLPDTKQNRKRLSHAMNASQNSVIQCFTGDTKIDLLDGTTVSIDSLVNDFEGKYVLSCCDNGKIIPGKIINAMQTGKTNRLCKVTLDNGEIIKCTPEHQFMLRDGVYEHAINLKQGDSLMPCYKKKDVLGYYYVKRNDLTNKPWASVHRIVCKYYNRNIEKSEVVHHKDFNKENNNPDNLVIMDKKEHIIYHSNIIRDTCKRHADEQGVSVHEYMRLMGLKYTSEQRSADVIKRINEIKEGKRENRMWAHFLTKEHSEKQSLAMSMKNRVRAQLYKEWDKNQREAVSKEMKRRLEVYGNTMCLSPDKLSEIGRRNINKIWQGGDQNKIAYMKENIKRCGTNTSYFKFKKHVLKMIEEGIVSKESVLDDSFEEVWNDYRLNCGIRLASIPKYTKSLHDRFIKEVFNNHKVVSVELMTLEEEVPVYDIEIENNDNTHNFALSAGVFVHNSSASRMAWIAGTHIAEEMLMHNMQSVMIGGVHDSTYLDIYPGELVPIFKICQFHAATVPNVIYDWMNGNKMTIDFGLGQSWGREMDIKSFEEKEGKFILNLKGGNVNWDYLKRELDDGYEYELLEMKDGDPIPPEEREDLPIEVPTQFVSVKLAFPDPCPNMEFKSKYYVGNGYYGKREED